MKMATEPARTDRVPPFEHDRASRLMEEMGADLLLGCSRANVGYLADYTYYVAQGLPVRPRGREAVEHHVRRRRARSEDPVLPHTREQRAREHLARGSLDRRPAVLGTEVDVLGSGEPDRGRRRARGRGRLRRGCDPRARPR